MINLSKISSITTIAIALTTAINSTATASDMVNYDELANAKGNSVIYVITRGEDGKCQKSWQVENATGEVVASNIPYAVGRLE